MDKILTIIIPTYNMERYLRHCLDSLIVTNIAKVEVLVINDGSKDSSSAIAHEYQDKYPQTFRVIDKENGNYGSCVNTGLKEATGKYVKVLDADDWFDSKVLVDYIDFLQQTNVDMILTDYRMISTSGEVVGKVNIPYPDKAELIVAEHCSEKSFMDFQMHAVTYLCSALKENHYEQTTGVSYTDQEWIFLPVTYMNTFCHFKGYLYQYQIGREGQTTDPSVSSKQVKARFILVYKRLSMYDQILTNGTLDKRKQFYLQHRLFVDASVMYGHGLIDKTFSKDDIISFDKEVKKLCRYIYEEIPKSAYCQYKGHSYICYWRKHHHLPFIVKTLCVMHNIKTRFKRICK